MCVCVKEEPPAVVAKFSGSLSYYRVQRRFPKNNILPKHSILPLVKKAQKAIRVRSSGLSTDGRIWLVVEITA
jgi:hypothetical protein